MRPVVDQGCGLTLFLFGLFSFGCCSLVCGKTLIFGTGDWFAFGEPFFCGLFTPTYPLPGHRLVPESHLLNNISAWEGSELYITISSSIDHLSFAEFLNETRFGKTILVVDKQFGLVCAKVLIASKH